MLKKEYRFFVFCFSFLFIFTSIPVSLIVEASEIPPKKSIALLIPPKQTIYQTSPQLSTLKSLPCITKLNHLKLKNYVRKM